MNAVIVVEVPDGDGEDDTKRIATAGRTTKRSLTRVEAGKLLSLLATDPSTVWTHLDAEH